MSKRRRGFGGRMLGGPTAPTGPNFKPDLVDVDGDGGVVVEPDLVDVDGDGGVVVEPDLVDVDGDGGVVVEPDLVDVDGDGGVVVEPDLVDVDGDGGVVVEPDLVDVDGDGGVVVEPDLVDVDGDGGVVVEPDPACEDQHDPATWPAEHESEPPREGIDRSEASVPGHALETRTRISVHADGGLEVADDDGHLLQYAPAHLAAGVRYLLARLRQESEVDLPKSVGFTSTLSGEGVSVLARTFAAVLANDTGHNVCFVDLNWWSFEERMYRPGEAVYGLYEAMWMDKPLDSVLLDFPSDRFAYLPAGSAPSEALPTLANHPRLTELMIELGGRFDHLVLDLPAVLSTSDAISLSQFADQIVLVVQQGVAARSQVQSALSDLGDSRPVAAVLNQTRSSIPGPVRRLIGS